MASGKTNAQGPSGKRYAYGTVQSITTTFGGETNQYINITGLSFKPSVVFATRGWEGFRRAHYAQVNEDNLALGNQIGYCFNEAANAGVHVQGGTTLTSNQILSNGFRLVVAKNFSTNEQVTWHAYE